MWLARKSDENEGVNEIKMDPPQDIWKINRQSAESRKKGVMSQRLAAGRAVGIDASVRCRIRKIPREKTMTTATGHNSQATINCTGLIEIPRTMM